MTNLALKPIQFFTYGSYIQATTTFVKYRKKFLLCD